MSNLVKLIVALAFVGGGFFAYEWLDGQLLALRILALLVCFGLAAGVFSTSQAGKVALGYFAGAQLELKKVVWPERQDTLRTTLLIFVAVFLVALFLWAVDSLIALGLRMVLS